MAAMASVSGSAASKGEKASHTLAPLAIESAYSRRSSGAGRIEKVHGL